MARKGLDPVREKMVKGLDHKTICPNIRKGPMARAFSRFGFGHDIVRSSA